MPLLREEMSIVWKFPFMRMLSPSGLSNSAEEKLPSMVMRSCAGIEVCGIHECPGDENIISRIEGDSISIVHIGSANPCRAKEITGRIQLADKDIIRTGR